MDSARGERPGLGPSSLPYGLMSLWDMINCTISQLAPLCAELALEKTLLKYAAFQQALPDEPLPDSVASQVAGWMKIARQVATEFECPAALDRIKIIDAMFAGNRGPLTSVGVATELRVLLETIISGLNGQTLYRYPKAQADVLWGWKDNWAAVTKAFPSSEKDVLAGVDLWALGHSVASVFHFMRVLEHGLRALAKDVGRTFDIQQWQNIIDEINSAIETERKALPRGQQKNERLQFLSEAAKEFVYFKDGWRNYVSHGRGFYDEHQARSVMEHVRAFMTTLSSRLSEA